MGFVFIYIVFATRVYLPLKKVKSFYEIGPSPAKRCAVSVCANRSADARPGRNAGFPNDRIRFRARAHSRIRPDPGGSHRLRLSPDGIHGYGSPRRFAPCAAPFARRAAPAAEAAPAPRTFAISPRAWYTLIKPQKPHKTAPHALTFARYAGRIGAIFISKG